MSLDELVAELQELEPDEKLEWLTEFSDQLPELSEARKGIPLPETCRVQECQTPVYLWVEEVDGKVHLEADVSPKSPVVRGLVTLLVVGLEGRTRQEVLDLPDDLLRELGLSSALGMTRQQGFRGMIARIKRSFQSVD